MRSRLYTVQLLCLKLKILYSVNIYQRWYKTRNNIAMSMYYYYQGGGAAQSVFFKGQIVKNIGL